MRDAVRSIEVADPVEEYVVAIVQASRQRADLRLGASPRASVALYRAAQAAAYLEGRDFVLPDDVKAIAGPVLAHRVLLDIDRQLRGATAEAVIDEILAAVDAPPVETDQRAAGTPGPA